MRRSRDLGDDRGGGDAGAARVAVDEVPLRTGEVAERDEVGDDQVGRDGEPRERVGHREARGLQDVDPVDRLVIDDADADGDGALADDVEQRLALSRAQELRVGEPPDAAVRPDDDGGGDDRPGERAAPRLVDAGHPGDACLPGSSLVVVRRRRRRRHVDLIDYCSGAR
jgi:hypothetical protein